MQVLAVGIPHAEATTPHPRPALGIFADHPCSFPALFRLQYVFSLSLRDLLFGFVRIILIVFSLGFHCWLPLSSQFLSQLYTLYPIC